MATATATLNPTSTPIPANKTGFGNEFLLHDTDNKTEIVYRLQQGGPIHQGATESGPVLEYTGAEGSLTFEGTQILQESTALGTLLTVTLNIVPDLRTLTFSMLMPQITAAGNAGVGSSQTFETIGIKAQHPKSLVGPVPPGADPTYVAMKLHGTAKSVEIAQ